MARNSPTRLTALEAGSVLSTSAKMKSFPPRTCTTISWSLPFERPMPASSPMATPFGLMKFIFTGSALKMNSSVTIN